MLAFALLVAGHARGDEVWTITTSDFLDRRGAVIAIDSAGVRYRESSGETRQLPWSQILELTRGGERGGVPGDLLALRMSNGDCFVGDPISLEDETLVWSTPLGEFSLPLRQVRAITRGDQKPARADPPQRDRLRLANGDRLEGVVQAIDRESATMSNGTETPVPWDLITEVQFAGVNGAEELRGRAFRIAIAGGSILGAQHVQLAGQQLQIRTADAASRSVPIGSVMAIEQTGGPVTWLSDLRPIESVHQPYFSSNGGEIRFNATTRGAPIRDGERPARSGIGVSSYSRLVWPLAGDHKAFRAKFAIDGALPYANVTVRVKLDDRVAYEMADVTAATPSQLVIIPLAGASQLTLEVDYGKTYDVQDRLNWIEPALLREIPSTQPAE